MIRLAVRCRPEDSEPVLASLLELAPNGVEEERGAGFVEYAIYGAPGEVPELGELEAASGDATVEVSTTTVPDDWADRWADFHKPIEARGEGIEVVYQDLALADNLTAAQNVFLGREIKKGIWPFRILDKQAMINRSAELFAELKSETRPRDLVKKMSGGQRQAVAIARTRLSNAKLVLMDEPTATRPIG